MIDIHIKSKRGTRIPVSIAACSQKSGLLMLAHSFKSDRFENGRFMEVMERLSKKGYHSIAMDFPGSPFSEETYSSYSLSNCLDDMDTCFEYMCNRYDIDENRMWLLGYSMGGRLISLFCERHPEFNGLIFWAACNRPFTVSDRFLEQNLSVLQKQAEEDGSVEFYDIFEKNIEVFPGRFVDDLLNLDALDPLEEFKGRALIVQGDHDTTIEDCNASLIYEHLNNAREREIFIIEGADHGFGIWDGREEDSRKLLDKTISFISK